MLQNAVAILGIHQNNVLDFGQKLATHTCFFFHLIYRGHRVATIAPSHVEMYKLTGGLTSVN